MHSIAPSIVGLTLAVNLGGLIGAGRGLPRRCYTIPALVAARVPL